MVTAQPLWSQRSPLWSQRSPLWLQRSTLRLQFCRCVIPALHQTLCCIWVLYSRQSSLFSITYSLVDCCCNAGVRHPHDEEFHRSGAILASTLYAMISRLLCLRAAVFWFFYSDCMFLLCILLAHCHSTGVRLASTAWTRVVKLRCVFLLCVP